MEGLDNKFNYDYIAKIIAYIEANYNHQLSLEMIAEHIQLNPLDLQRIFQQWADISPNTFFQYCSIINAKNALRETYITNVPPHPIAFSNTFRFHNLFVKIEYMTPAEYTNGGANLEIFYSTHHSPFGRIFIASTIKGICHLAFIDNLTAELAALIRQFPNARLIGIEESIHLEALIVFNKNVERISPISVHLYGTAFQIKVWEALLNIPTTNLWTYATLAAKIGNPKASRAVGTAIAKNPIAYLIPCHRVIQSSGNLGGYRWTPIRKAAIIIWEAALTSRHHG